eukprot:1478258-Amphidinium_carterae.1
MRPSSMIASTTCHSGARERSISASRPKRTAVPVRCRDATTKTTPSADKEVAELPRGSEFIRARSL